VHVGQAGRRAHAPSQARQQNGRWTCSLRNLNLHRDEGERDLGRSSPEYRERKAQSAAAATFYRSRTFHQPGGLDAGNPEAGTNVYTGTPNSFKSCLLPVVPLKDPPAAGFAFVFVWVGRAALPVAALKPDPQASHTQVLLSSSRRSRLSPSKGRLAAARPSHSQPRGLLS
jgi:hypothetical protein